MAKIRELEAFEATHAAAGPVAASNVGVSQAEFAAAMELLDGGEIIQLSLKPSFWYIALASANTVATMAIVVAVALLIGTATTWTAFTTLAVEFAVLATVLRIAFAALQWASRLYVLTNRRVIAFRGVLSVKVTECRLSRVGDAALRARWYERLLRLGTIAISTADAARQPVLWTNVAKPAEVYEAVLRAIKRAQ